MHPHLSREAIILDVETTRYGRAYAGRRLKITHVEKDPSTRGAVGYMVRLEDGGDELNFAELLLSELGDSRPISETRPYSPGCIFMHHHKMWTHATPLGGPQAPIS